MDLFSVLDIFSILLNVNILLLQIFAAVAVPLDLKGPADVFFTAAIEAIYALPSNQSYFIYPPIINSTSARKFVYDLIERKIDS